MDDRESEIKRLEKSKNYRVDGQIYGAEEIRERI